MANLAILASGNGSNFQAIAEVIANSRHKIVCLVCDRRNAFVFKRAENMNIPSFYVSYKNRDKAGAEREIAEILSESSADLIALAGFMRLLTPELIDKYPGKIINIHPSLLPKYPGTHGIKDSYDSEDFELGITIHRIDYGLDTGPVIVQKSFTRCGDESLDEIESKIHKLEHKHYPAVLQGILDDI